jgi:G:T/U-mismatch repair DNA glycosylase
MQANKSGEMFARSEIEATEALEVFAREVGTEPSYDTWQAARVEFINGYVMVKPQAKGDAADQAFKRFKDRLVDRFGITVPKAVSEGAVKKAAERKAKEDKLISKYADATPTLLRSQIEACYQTLAKNPDSKVAKAQATELAKVLKVKTRDSDKAERDEIKAIKDELREALKLCDDVIKLEAALEALQ